MRPRNRHCIAKRVTMMVALLDQPSTPRLSELVDVGCQCPNQERCDLAQACRAIHLAFRPPSALSLHSLI